MANLRKNTVHILIILVGFLLIYISTDSRLVEYSTFIGAMGGSIFGVGASLVLSRLAGKSELLKIAENSNMQFEMLRGFDHLSSRPELIKEFIGPWYCYTVSPRPDENQWRLAKYKIEASKTTGLADFDCKFEDNDGKTAIYTYSAFVRDDRLVIIGKSNSVAHEPSVLQIFPFAGAKKAANHLGFTFHRSWSGKNSISSSILSREPIKNFKTDKKYSEINSAYLDTVWVESLLKQNEIFLPRMSGNFKL